MNVQQFDKLYFTNVRPSNTFYFTNVRPSDTFYCYLCTILIYRFPIDFVAFPLVVFVLAGVRVLYSGELLVPSS